MNALIASCGRGGRPDLALAAFNEMQSQFGVRPDGRSYRSAVIACNQAEHKRKRNSHREPVVDDIEANEVDSSVQWWECSLGLLRRMREGNLVPDVPTYSSAISSCEAAGEWQRALGVLQMMMDDDADLENDSSLLNLYCFNAAISACEKGGAWVEALELYERMLDIGGSIYPNFVTLSSLVVALDNAGQKELAESKYDEGRKNKIVKPWRWTQSQCGEAIQALVSIQLMMASFLLYTQTSHP
jgi:pentatricopeptide repeat domain-containing protein 1